MMKAPKQKELAYTWKILLYFNNQPSQSDFHIMSEKGSKK